MPPVPFKVKAVYEYRSQEPDDLNFDNGQIITVTEEEDEDWYTGEYSNAAGEKLQGIFPRNFVEKYEPAIPSRPVRAPKRAPTAEPSENVPEPPPPQSVPVAAEVQKGEHEEEREPAREPSKAARPEPEAPPPAPKPQPAAPAVTSSTAAAAKAPPPVAEKPTSSSFKDRIAAFNKPAAAPVTPFKAGGGGPSTGFIKKPFVAPPPSRNAYVPPPPREPPAQKPYRREEDLSVNESAAPEPIEAAAQPDPEAEDQPKPQSLKERIALLQKQQMEQAARNSEKKEKPKKPPKKKIDTESSEQAPSAAQGLTRLDSSETVGRPSSELPEQEHEPTPLVHRTTGLGTPQPQPSRELVSDTNDADDSEVADDEDIQGTSTEEERPKSKGADVPATAASSRKSLEATREPEADDEEEEEEEEEEEDPDVRHRREVRERMAKISGGMGMMGMFGPSGGGGLPGAARKAKTSSEPSRQHTETHAHDEPQERAAPVPIMALPGMAQSFLKRQEQPVASPEDEDDATARPIPPATTAPVETEDSVIPPAPQRRSTDRAAPPVPQDRAALPAPPRDARAAPPPPPSGPRAAPPVPQSPNARPPPPSLPQAAPETSGYEESDEPVEQDEDHDDEVPDTPASPKGMPPLPPSRHPEPPKLDTAEEAIYPPSEKRASRVPPPIPISPASPSTRAPPPPPPGAPPSRRSTADSGIFRAGHATRSNLEHEGEVSAYEGDIDSDIASNVKHKNALHGHDRDSSLDEGLLTDEVSSPKSPPVRAAPPLPPVNAPQNVPPPLPPATTPKSRRSVDVPRTAPPPVPPPKQPEDDDYDPYDPNRYSAPQHAPPMPHSRAPYSTNLRSPREEVEEDDLYGVTPQQTNLPPPPSDRPAPPPPPSEPSDYIPPSGLAPPSTGSPEAPTDIRRSGTLSRRSMDHSRGSEQGFMAAELDLGKKSLWWTQDKLLPPSLQGRPDILYEMETNPSQHGAKSTVSKGIYVLYMDYSQTTIHVNYDENDPSHATLEQNHERPPPAPRRDQLENASEQYGKQMARVAGGLAGTTVADGSARGFVLELIKPYTTALPPVGTRAYGALVYANLGNASTQQFDEIRAGDIVTFRNAKFSGHKGSLHQKYSFDVGKPEHVAVVIDWDGTKKKIRAWEQGRDVEKGKKPKIREESFKVGDLRSGEVMVWRVMPRTWVGWDTVKS